MRFLIDEDLPRSIGALLQRYGHEAIDVRDIASEAPKILRSRLMLRTTDCAS